MDAAKGKELVFQLKDVFSQFLWRQGDFPGAQEHDHRQPDGDFMVNVLYSLSRSVDSKNLIAAALARDLHNQLMAELDAIEIEMTARAKQFIEELAADVIQVPEQFQAKSISIDGEKLRKLPIKFVRCFVLFDHAMHALTEQYRSARLKKDEFMVARKALAKPIRRFMFQNNAVVKAYHQKRRELKAAEAEAGAASPQLTAAEVETIDVTPDAPKNV